MKKYLTMGIFAHANAGKTTLTENLLFLNNQIKEIGRVDSGNTVTDNLAVEKNRGITVRSSLVSINQGENVIQIIDTPGHVDFSGEVERAMNVLDFAILVISAVEGVEAQTYAIWKELRKNNVPTIIYVNKVDRKNADFQRTMQDIAQKLSPNIFSFVDERYDTLSKDDLVESFANVNNNICEKFVNNEEVTRTQLMSEILSSFNSSEAFPVFGGSALKNLGVDALYSFLGNDIKNNILDSNELNAYAYMIRVENGQRDSYIKILSGNMSNFSDITVDDKKYKLTNMRIADGASHITVNNAEAGQIVIVNGLECLSGTSIGDYQFKRTEFVQPLIKMQLKAENPNDSLKLVEIIKILNMEDPHYEAYFDEYTKEIKINLMGEVQAQVLSELIETRFSIKNTIEKPRIIFKETPTKSARAKSSYTSVSQIEIEVNPLVRGAGLIINSKYSTDFLHIKYQNQAKRLIEQYCKQGIYGWNVTDAEISIVGGKFDSMGSDPQHFNICTPLALFRAFKLAGMHTLEPMIEFYLDIPEETSNAVVNNLYSRKAKILSFDTKGKSSILIGIVPFSEMITFPITLNKLTSGMGTYSYEFSEYKFADEQETFEKRFGPDPSNEVKFVIGDMKASLDALDNEGTGKKPRRSKFAREQMEREIAEEKRNAARRSKPEDYSF